MRRSLFLAVRQTGSYGGVGSSPCSILSDCTNYLFSSRGASFREKIGPSGLPRKATASSGQASYPSPRRKRQVSLTPLSLLPPQKLGTAFAGTPVYGGLLTATRRLSCAAAADAIVTFQIFLLELAPPASSALRRWRRGRKPNHPGGVSSNSKTQWSI